MTSCWAHVADPEPAARGRSRRQQRFVDRTLETLADDVAYRIAHPGALNDPPQVIVGEVVDGWRSTVGAFDGWGVRRLGRSTVGAFDGWGVRVVAAPTNHAPVRPTVGCRIDNDGKSVAIAGDTVPCDGLDLLPVTA